MEQRKYSFSEIQAMRQALAFSYPSGVCYYADERSKEIEERIRTYMVAGIDPQEVINACQEMLAQQQRMQLAMQQSMEKNNGT